MKEFQIKALTYPEQRLEYFKAQIESAKRSIRWWQTSAASRGYAPLDIHDRCSELGWRINFYQDALNALQGEQMTEIRDLQAYNTGMHKSLLDKLWWLDKIDDQIQCVMDYGCADGALLAAVHQMNPDIALFGYDVSDNMIRLARHNVPNTILSNDFRFLMSLEVCAPDKGILVASSVLHEIENYSQNTADDYSNIFDSGYQYIAIRDMFVSQQSKRLSDPLAVAMIRQSYPSDKLTEFESIYGSIDRNENLIHFLLKYRYTVNWDREVRENYLPYTIEEFLHKIPADYEIIHFEHYTLPYLRTQAKSDFGIDLCDATHGKILLRKRI